MTSTEFLEGEVYYRLTFPDTNLLYPQVQSFVFVGKNLSDDDTENSWYFQFVDSYAKCGSILKTKGGDRKISIVTRDDLSDMLNLTQLTRELKVTETRRRKARESNGPGTN